ncbi:hypothetical protein SAMN04487905_10159 [Actinopolyspora xinjiangensis]|uniref:Uncharacterized protein n=1 Tax=Actinopolyspora xinjiangensis TaxID=405564 RepID=A0A1H0NA88_9ACTN|nr:hypothetical protein [Actinopolyspora xinjiangensis]SDO89639.1 hypothetical protein SAMN04487905_10159 [Actinopolyspora xinjiangensis]
MRREIEREHESQEDFPKVRAHRYSREFAGSARSFRRLPGRRIGAAVSEIEAIARAGGSPERVLGDPAGHARRLAAREPTLPLPSFPRCVLALSVALLGAFAVLGGLHRLTTGGEFRLGLSGLVVAALLVVMAALLVGGYRRDQRCSPMMLPVVFWLASLPEPAESLGSGPAVPPGLVLPVGAVLLVSGAVLWLATLPRPGRIVDSDGADRTELARPTPRSVVIWGLISVVPLVFAAANTWGVPF